MATTTFLDEVLSLRGTASVDEFHDMLTNVELKLGSLRVELVQALQSVFVVCDGDVDLVSSRLDELKNLDNDIKKLMAQISSERTALLMSEDQITVVKGELDECERNIKALQSLVTIVQCLDKSEAEVDILKSSKRILDCENEYQHIVSEFPRAGGHVWICGLRASISQISRETFDRALKEWSQKFRFSKNTLIIDPFSIEFTKLIETFKNLEHFTKVWEKFCNQLWSELFSNLCSPEYAIRIQKPQKTIRRSNPEATPATEKKPLDLGSPEDVDVKRKDVSNSNFKLVIKVRKLDTPYTSVTGVFNNILMLVDVLDEVFERDENTMQDLAEVISAKLVNKLLEICLKPLVLEKSNGDKQRAVIEMEQLQEFRGRLSECGFKMTDEPEIKLEDFESNFDGLFMNQLRVDLLAKIRTLVKSDVNQTIQVKLSNQQAENLRNPFHDHQFKISVPVSNIVEVLQDHLTKYPDDTKIVEHAFNLFISIIAVPKNETDAAEYLPLSSILIHNNCVFLSHHAEITFPFCEDKISLLNSKGGQVFAFMMRSIRTKINGMISTAMTGLNETKFSNGQSVGKFLAISAELDRLYRTFKDVLPKQVYRETLSTLVDHTVNEMCSKVLTWDDISASCADEVAESFTKFAISITSLYKRETPKSATSREIEVLIVKVVHKWERFRHLTFILKASMKDIEDKWVNGCGPLSQAFTPEELRKLVRALFQNTDRRAAFLSSIK